MAAVQVMGALLLLAVVLVILGSLVSAAWGLLKLVLMVIGALTLASWVFKAVRNDG